MEITCAVGIGSNQGIAQWHFITMSKHSHSLVNVANVSSISITDGGDWTIGGTWFGGWLVTPDAAGIGSTQDISS